jgi:hypothetical protein
MSKLRFLTASTRPKCLERLRISTGAIVGHDGALA